MAVDPNKLQKLVTHIQRTHDQMDQDKARYEKLTERNRLINSVPDITITEFYCRCHGDFVAPAGKIIFEDTLGQVCAYYTSYGMGYKVGDKPNRTFKVCKRKRFITDKFIDPYFSQSKLVQKQRQELEIAMLQPDDPRFKQYYGDPYKKFYAQQEAKAEAEWQSKRQRA